MNTFDFDDSMIEGIESNYRNMGGKQNTYYHVKRANYLIFRILESLRVIKF